MNTEAIADLPMNWYKFYTYVRLPLGIFIGFITLFTIETIEEALLGMLFLVLLSVLFGGLLKMKRLSFRANYVVLVLEPLLRAYERSTDTAVFLVVSVLLLLVWTLPNAIYFNKRAHLFKN